MAYGNLADLLTDTVTRVVWAIERVSRKYGLLINAEKTKVMTADGISAVLSYCQAVFYNLCVCIIVKCLQSTSNCRCHTTAMATHTFPMCSVLCKMAHRSPLRAFNEPKMNKGGSKTQCPKIEQ